MASQRKDGQKATLGAARAGLFGNILVSLLLTVLLGTVLAVLAAILLTRAEDGTAYITLAGCAISALLAFVGGMMAGRKCGGRGAISGLLFGFFYLLLLLLLSGVVASATSAPIYRAVGYVGVLLLSVLGGAAGTARGRRRRPMGRTLRRSHR